MHEQPLPEAEIAEIGPPSYHSQMFRTEPCISVFDPAIDIPNSLTVKRKRGRAARGLPFTIQNSPFTTSPLLTTEPGESLIRIGSQKQLKTF